MLAACHTLRCVTVAGGEVPGYTSLPEMLERGGSPTPAVEASEDEVAFWLYSSGSTGKPKGTRHVHGSLRGAYEAYAKNILDIRAEDVTFSASKIFHAYGLGNSMTFPMAVGGCAVLLPGRPAPDAVLATIGQHQPSLFYAAPTLYAALLARPDLGPGAGSSRLRLCVSAGEALPEAVGLRWREKVRVDILDGIGSTELLHIFLSNRADNVRYGTSGTPVPGYQARLVDEHGQDVPDGESGELLISGPTAAEGYWNQRERSRRTFMGEWTRTGDIYVREPDGAYRYQGRADDMFKVSGIWVSPFEVESALIAHPAVLEAAVVGIADAEGLMKPKAFVILQETAVTMDAAALHEALKEHVKAMAGVWKYPRWIEVVDSLPKTATGKIQRFLLRA
jgi:4-hydroxybenzoate-CoA ligase